jgi:hypothetical protein
MGLGGILMAATTFGVITFDPMMMVAGLAALLGGVVVLHVDCKPAFGVHEKRRGAASDADRPAHYCLVEDAPANRHS